jgi:hypothetical protein
LHNKARNIQPEQDAEENLGLEGRGKKGVKRLDNEELSHPYSSPNIRVIKEE